MTPCWLLVLLSLCSPLSHPGAVEGWGSLSTVPSEKECRPYIEKALKELSPQEAPQEAVDTTDSEETPVPAPSHDQEGSREETEQTTATETSDDVTTESTSESTETGEVTNAVATDGVSEEDSGEPVQADASAESVEEAQGTTESIAEESKETEEVKEEGAAEQPSTEDGAESAETTENVDASTESTPTDEQSAEGPDSATEQSEEQLKSEEQQSEEQPKSEEVEETQPSAEQGSEPSDEIIEEKSETSEDGAEEISGEEKIDETKEVTEESTEKADVSEETKASTEDQTGESTESTEITGEEVIDSIEATDSKEDTEVSESAVSTETTESTEPVIAEDTKESVEETTETSKEESTETIKEESTEQSSETPVSVEDTIKEDSVDSTESSGEAATATTESSESVEEKESVAEQVVANETIDATPTSEGNQTSAEANTDASEESAEKEEETAKEPEPTVEDQLTLEFETPKVRRPRDHITEILRLNPESAETELLLAKTIESTLKELKRLYDAAIKPLEILYKYRDLSNRHFGDPEIFSKPLILFMGPWSGGKSTILNYLLDNEFKSSSLRTGAEPSPAYFNILMGGDREEVLDGTQLAADWTFSGLQKFGQGLLDRLRGLRLNSPLLEKVNIVEIPGILEIRKQVERLFPFNDACQWFIDRADIIFLVYDPSKLDVGPETEAILDQLKGREYQTRIILNKADQVKPEELMRVQGTLIWNISPLMSSQEPPVMYSTSLWSIPYEQGAPSRLLHAQERAFLRDLRLAIDKRVENKIASARRFAVRVRNHAKMVDCYLTTYYNHKSFFGNRKKVADDIIESPQNYHIYEGLSTLTNISRYDLPDPEVYRDFFRLNNLYDFQRLSDTCTYFRGCPINRLDVAIAYDLPELVGKYRKQAERVLDAVAERAAKGTS